MKVQYIDYGVGNKKSVMNALLKIGHEVLVVTSPDDLDPDKPIILPGVGSFLYCKNELDRLGFFKTIKNMLDNNQIKKLIGICVGHQLLFESGAEDGGALGFGVFDGSIKHLTEIALPDKNHRLVTPNISWCKVQQTDTDKSLGKFYFIHSFGNSDSTSQIAYYNWNNSKITAISRKNGIWGAQFHPEKSGDAGLKLFDKMINSREETLL
ncbi:imidazole glycerol phosphate synthase subunit HisH [Gammaproteobacteria bacterium]|nr:imidazole glycerol phosphate synthase subunit HisH [Gammaproteobacteria bacterium]MDB4183652.1 imidazole glycerol phosphate synthase subunit HisH [Gammaproteobacteria bacterium]